MIKENTQEIYKNILTKNVFLECPEDIPGIELGEPIQADLERTVVTSDFFGDELPENSILVQHKCWFRPVLSPVKAHLTLAQVAGYRKVVFGLPERNFPILFQHPEFPHILISTTPLNNFIKGRFAPFADWKIVMNKINSFLGNETNEIYHAAVTPSYSLENEVPEDVEVQAFQKNATWFNNHIFFEQGRQIGVFEGYISGISPNGRQSLRPATRADCSGEAAMIPALEWKLSKSYSSRKIALQVMDGLFNNDKLADRNPSSPTYGGLKFYENLPAYYNDDNCRAAMSCILASELVNDLRFAENILRCLLSILRTTGPQGFRCGRLNNPSSFEAGKTWKSYQLADYVEYRPHYQAYMWAGFLQGYVLTGHREFLDKVKNAVSMTMEVFPNLVWTNGITQEYARLLLPLAFLVQIEDTSEHQRWLKIVAEALLENMVECGAIREGMGNMELGKYPAPRSNEEYGTTEAALIQQNGDPACDLVYTVNYAFIGLHEAACATGDKYYSEAENKLADFLCRIQASSKKLDFLDGCWIRGFDYELWEYYGSSADNGWGAWCVESGWTNTWIAATFALRRLNRSLLCHGNKDHYRKIFPEIYREMQVVHKDYIAPKTAMTVAPGAE